MSNHEFEPNVVFSGMQTDIKPIAIYLPQYHTFPENDAWWGKGFTEWVNVKKGEPLFEGHYQPRVPYKDFGYYDLSKVETMQKQCKLAKEHGIYGFAIYYYWFSGKQLMKEPMQILLEHPELDLPFFLIWANENWTRTWDGKANDVLIQQEYSDADAVQFIWDLKKYIDDDRYMRIDGKPVIAIYAPKEIPNLHKQVAIWRKTARTCGIGELYIMICDSSATAADLQIVDLVDAEYEFPPRLKGYVPSEFKPNNGTAYNYAALVESERPQVPYTDQLDIYRGAMLNWDNSGRRKQGYNCWSGFSFELFYLWLKAEIVYARKYQSPDKRFLFINAWNEWGEGTYLEPDERNGYAALNTLSRAIYSLPFAPENPAENKVVSIGTGIPADSDRSWMCRKMAEPPRIAVQAHVFYEELISTIVQYTNRITLPFDLYITTSSKEKAEVIRKYTDVYSVAEHVQIMVAANKGRDVVPFIAQMSPVIQNYDYLCHLHSKKSNHASIMGDIWRDYLYENLLASSDLVDEILDKFEQDPKLGIIMPENLDLLADFIEWGSNKKLAETLLQRIHLQIDLPDEIIFPAGDMFWMRTKAVKNLFDIAAWEDMIPEENKQIDATVMHAIERLWVYVAKANGYGYLVTRSVVDNRPMVYHAQQTPVSYTESAEKQPADVKNRTSKKKNKRTQSEEAMLNSTANTIGVIMSCKAVLFALVILLGKKIPVIKVARPESAKAYDPLAVAWMFGVKDCLTILRKAIGIYIQK